MNSDDRAWVEMLRETKTSGNIGFGGRQMRRLLGIVDGLWRPRPIHWSDAWSKAVRRARRIGSAWGRFGPIARG